MQQDIVETLSPETWVNITSYLTFLDCNNLSETSKYMRYVVDHDQFYTWAKQREAKKFSWVSFEKLKKLLSINTMTTDRRNFDYFLSRAKPNSENEWCAYYTLKRTIVGDISKFLPKDPSEYIRSAIVVADSIVNPIPSDVSLDVWLLCTQQSCYSKETTIERPTNIKIGTKLSLEAFLFPLLLKEQFRLIGTIIGGITLDFLDDKTQRETRYGITWAVVRALKNKNQLIFHVPSFETKRNILHFFVGKENVFQLETIASSCWKDPDIVKILTDPPISFKWESLYDQLRYFPTHDWLERTEFLYDQDLISDDYAIAAIEEPTIHHYKFRIKSRILERHTKRQKVE